MDTGLDIFEGAMTLCLCSSNALLLFDSLDVRVSSECLDPSISCSSFSLIPTWSFAKADGFLENWASRLLLFTFFCDSASDETFEKSGKLDREF